MKKIKKKIFKNFDQFWPKMQVYSLYFSSENGKILTKKFFSTKIIFFLVYDFWTFQKCKKIKKKIFKNFDQFWQKNATKKFSKYLANFDQKCKSIAFTFRQKMAKFWPKIFFPQKSFFFLSMTSGHSKNAKKSKKKFF